MTTIEEGLVGRCLERLRALPFVAKATLLAGAEGRARTGAARLRIATPFAREEFDLVVLRTHLTRAAVDGVLARTAGRGRRPWILFAPHVGRPLGEYLDEQGANFVDIAGNCRLRIGRRHIARIEGRPPERATGGGRGIGAPGFRILFALLVRPALVNAPIRELARAAGVATATAADRTTRLRDEGLAHQPHRVLDLWLKGYETLVRPKLLIGRYRTQEQDPEELERHIEAALGPKPRWAYGAGAAAHRLTGYYRGAETVLHLEPEAVDVAKRLRALRADDGPLILMGTPGPLAFEGALPRTVAPLLVYTELLLAADRRAREAAVEVGRKYLKDLLEPAH